MNKTITTLNFLKISMVDRRQFYPTIRTFVRQTIADKQKRCDLAASKMFGQGMGFDVSQLNGASPGAVGFPEGRPQVRKLAV